MELQRYEGLYKEVMMRADRSEADIAYMQVGLAEVHTCRVASCRSACMLVCRAEVHARVMSLANGAKDSLSPPELGRVR
eukprot:scaffold65810_cov24-Tisochrysis_lutea.AAC.1